MSFFKPEHITVRSIILIVGGLVLFSSFAAAEQQRESLVITDVELLVFKLFFLIPKFPSKGGLFLNYQTGGLLLFLAGSPEAARREELTPPTA